MVNKDLHLDKVKNTHVKKAAKFWAQQENFLPFHNSHSYDVIIEGKPYPPKAISSKAYEIATGVKILPSEFFGARKGRWNNLLEKLGFQIVEKGSYASIADRVSSSLKLSQNTRLKKIAEEGLSKPKAFTVKVKRYPRSPYVVAERLYLADGRCEKCKKKAPFLRQSDGTPFLEVHHVKPLSVGGTDTVDNTQALCPNCHSEVHDKLNIERQVE